MDAVEIHLIFLVGQGKVKAMSRASYSEGPITHWGRIPVYITTIVLGFQILALILGILLILSRSGALGALLSFLVFSPDAAWGQFQVWRPLTYLLIDSPSFFSLFGLLFLWMYGREVESYLGRARAIVFYLLALLVPVLLSTLMWLIALPTAPLIGGYFMSIAVVIGFATLYPNIEWFMSIRFKWFAWACVVLGGLSPLQGGGNQFGELVTYAGSCTAIWGFIRWLQLGGEMPEFRFGRLFKRKPKLKVVRGGDEPTPRTKPKPRASSEVKTADVFKPGASVPQAVVDQILEKVAREGIGSLTPKEKLLLEKHSDDLKKRAGRA